MLFSTNILKNNKKNTNNISNNISLFEKCLELIKRSSNTYKLIREATIDDIGDSEDTSILNKNTIYHIVSILIDNTSSNLTKLYEDYIVLFDRYINASKSKISESVLYNIDDDFNYEDTRYIYTNLRKVLSYSSLKTDINKESAIMIQNINNFISTRQISELYKLREIFNEYKNNILIDLDMVRATILAKNGPVSNEIFVSALYKYFRPNKIEAGSNISKAELLEIYKDYSTMNIEKELIKKDFDKYNNDLAIIKDTLNSIPFDKLNKDTMINEFVNYPRDVIYMWYEVCRMILDIYAIYFSARLDASIENLITDIDILVSAKDYVENRQQTEDNKQ